MPDNVNNSQCYFPLSWKQPQKLPYHGPLGKIVGTGDELYIVQGTELHVASKA